MFRWFVCSFLVSLVASELSQECLDEMQEIQLNPLYYLELARLNSEVALVPPANYCTGNATFSTCIIDYEDFETEIETICTKNVDGVYLESGYIIKCVDPNNGNERQDDIRNLPLCAGLSCQKSNLDAFLDGQYEDIRQLAETNSGSTCEIENFLEDADGNPVSSASRPVLSLCGLVSMAWYLIV
jgi:hypothetical protein